VKLREQLEVGARDHAAVEALLDESPAGAPIDIWKAGDGGGPLFDCFDEETGSAGSNNLRERAAGRRDDGRAAGERFGEDDAERFVPANRDEQAGGAAEKIVFGGVVDLADPLDAVATEMRSDLAIEEGALRTRFLAIAGEDQTALRGAGDGDREVGAFDVVEPAEKNEWSVRGHEGLEGEFV
jgi:hypothetical protein